MSPPIGFTPPTSEEIAQVYRNVGADEKSIKEAKEILLTWLKSQPHLPDNIDDRRLERVYLNSKCSLERSKVALDAYFSLRSRLPEILQNRDPLRKEIQAMMDVIMIFPMPRLTPEGYRVLIVSVIDPAVSHFDADVYKKMVLMMLEVRLAEDCVAGDVYIVDCSGFSVSHITAIGPSGVKNLELCIKTAFASRIKAIHFINPSHIMDILYKIVVHTLSTKLAKRVTMHKNLETVHQCVPSECIPNELGGSGGPATDHWDVWKKKLLSYRDWFIQQDKIVSDETKRLGEIPYGDSLFGSEGSYRRLQLD